MEEDRRWRGGRGEEEKGGRGCRGKVREGMERDWEGGDGKGRGTNVERKEKGWEGRDISPEVPEGEIGRRIGCGCCLRLSKTC